MSDQNKRIIFSDVKQMFFLLLDSVKLTLAESRVYSFCSFFVRSIFLRRCEGFFLSSGRPCFYKISCYPVVLFVSILSSVGSISCLCGRTHQHPLWPDFYLVSLQLHSKSTLRAPNTFDIYNTD